MRQPTRHTAVLVLLSLLASFIAVTATAGTASAAESVPTLQWPAVNVAQNLDHTVTAPNGDVTVPCTGTGSGSDLVTYNSSGQVVRQLDHTSYIDGVQNCMIYPTVDKNGTLYGVPQGQLSGGGYGYGPNLLAYSGNTLKWRYPAHCDNNNSPAVAVGGDGNIYVTTRGHLIGLAPDLAGGQTQPTKLVDVTIPTDCSIKLFPYKDGIMLHGQQSNALFYNYAGKSLDSIPGQLWTEKLNKDGRLFTYSTVAGSYTSISVSAWDPRTGQTTWTTSASTSGANTNGSPNLYAMEDGGVAALITEQKMVGGVPASPTQWVQTVSVINSAGSKTRSFQLSSDYSNGGVTGSYDGTLTITPDNTGKLMFVRGMNLNTGLSWPNPSTVPAIYVGVYDPASDSMTYEQVMRGDLAKSGGPDGYSWDYGANSVSIAGNTVYLMAACTNNCNGDYNTKLYAIQVSGLGMDYPRGDVLTANTPAQPSPVSYVAMGDSYSSGQGAGVYDDGTVTSTNRCYKSLNAYGRVSDRNPTSALSLSNFAACGGSVTSDINTSWTYSGVPPQDTALSSTTERVTISIGGNDIGFADVIKTCADPTKDCDGAFTVAENELSVLDNKLQSTYLDILQKAPQAQVYVLGYPPILAAGSSGCLVGNNGTSAPFFGADRIQKGVTLSGDLNTSIKNNVNTIRALGTDYQRLHFVDASAPGSPFIGHDVCSSDPYVNGLTLPPGDSSESFHPNVKGQQAYANLLAAAMTP